MTNEEKANEIAQLADYTHNFRDVDIAFKSAMNMAEWKDKKAKEQRNYENKKVLEIDDLRKAFLEDEEMHKANRRVKSHEKKFKNEDCNTLQIGDKVKNSVFGEGVIINTDDTYLYIDFAFFKKRLIKKFAILEKI